MRKLPTPSRIIRRLRSEVGRRIVIDTNADVRRTVVLAGTRRSGTTWVSDIINHGNTYRDVFEPFHRVEVPLCKEFEWRQYLRPGVAREPFLSAAGAILAGRVNNRWVNLNNRRVFPRRRLVKDIRANLFLGWLHGFFPEVPIVLLLRHPCAVASSCVALGWEADMEMLLSQRDLVEDFLAPYAGFMRDARDEFERNIVLWCVETMVPLRQLPPDSYHVVFYERLAEYPDDEVPPMLRFVGDADATPALAQMKVPSRTSRSDNAIQSGRSSVASWRDVVSPAQLARAVELIRVFGLDAVYDADTMPRPAGIESFRSHRAAV